MDAIVAFAAALLALRLAGDLARRWRMTRRPELAWWAWSLGAYAIAAAAIAWGESAGWDARSFRVYYAAGALLTAPLLGVKPNQLEAKDHKIVVKGFPQRNMHIGDAANHAR